MRIFALTAYDGTPFGGWQVQTNTITVQHHIERALEVLLKQAIKIVGASRTDAGVHAQGQVFHCDVPEDADLQRLHRGLNGVLPPEIRILELRPVAFDAHAQRSALSKIYDYFLQTTDEVLPFDRLYCVRVPPLDLQAMRLGAAQLVGTRDFNALCNRGSRVNSTVRTLFRSEICAIAGGVQLTFEGDGFLYKMVRNCVGLLLEVARGQRAAQSIAQLLETKNRTLAAPAAPARGLFLRQIDYGPMLTWQTPHTERGAVRGAQLQ